MSIVMALVVLLPCIMSTALCEIIDMGKRTTSAITMLIVRSQFIMVYFLD